MNSYKNSTLQPPSPNKRGGEKTLFEDTDASCTPHVSSGVVVFNRAGDIIHINNAALALWHYENVEQLLGQPVENMWDEPHVWWDACANARLHGQDLFHLYGKHYDGSREQFEVLFDEDSAGHATIVCRHIDTTVIVTPDALVARILQMADVAIIACNEQGIIIQSNDQASEMFGYNANQLLGLSVHELLPPNLRQRHAIHVRNFIATPATMIPMGNRGEIIGYRKDGSRFSAEASLSKFRDGNNWVMLASIRDLTKEKRQAAHAQWLTTHDTLTGLPNRTFILEHLIDALVHSSATSSQIALLLIDLDAFSLISDSHGHEFADQVLIAISERLCQAVAHRDMVGRLDGKTFIVLRESCPSPDIAGALATHINAIIRQPLEFKGQKLFITASIGVVIGDGNNYNSDEMLRDANIAMRHVKIHGRDNWILFNPEHHTKALRRSTIISGLRVALDRKEFSIRLQPIVDALCGTLRGAEVLLRWNTTNGFISPDEFIPIAEQEGTIVAIGIWVFAQGCRIAAQLQREYGPQAPYLTINVSARQLSDPQVVEQFIANLQAYKVNPKGIVLELTETSLITDTNANITVLNRLVAAGLRLAVDDFGTGYSSLLQLLSLPVSTLKIDKAFVTSMEQRGEHYTIVDSVLKMSRSLHLTTVAEGVEHQAQAELLRELGCDLLQGYYFAKPLEEQDFFRLVAQNCDQPLAVIGDIAFIIYSSTANENIQPEHMHQILKRARVRNAELNITGCLFYLDGGFIQYIEGPEAALQTVMAIIRADPRHYAIQEIVAGKAQRRMFLNWRMSFGELDAKELPSSIAQFRSSGQGLNAIASNPWLAYNLFRAMSLGLAEN